MDSEAPTDREILRTGDAVVPSDGNCEVRAQRHDPVSVEFSLKGSVLTLLTSTPSYETKA